MYICTFLYLFSIIFLFFIYSFICMCICMCIYGHYSHIRMGTLGIMGPLSFNTPKRPHNEWYQMMVVEASPLLHLGWYDVPRDSPIMEPSSAQLQGSWSRGVTKAAKYRSSKLVPDCGFPWFTVLRIPFLFGKYAYFVIHPPYCLIPPSLHLCP